MLKTLFFWYLIVYYPICIAKKDSSLNIIGKKIEKI